MNLNNSQALKRLNKLEYNNFLTIKSKESKPVEIKITSIPNSNVLIEQLTKNNYDELKMKRKFSNVYIIDTKEDTNLISLFDSFEEYNAPCEAMKEGTRPNHVYRFKGIDSSRTVWIIKQKHPRKRI